VDIEDNSSPVRNRSCRHAPSLVRETTWPETQTNPSTALATASRAVSPDDWPRGRSILPLSHNEAPMMPIDVSHPHHTRPNIVDNVPKTSASLSDEKLDSRILPLLSCSTRLIFTAKRTDCRSMKPLFTAVYAGSIGQSSHDNHRDGQSYSMSRPLKGMRLATL
jgi:hypothetical protein